MASGHVIAFNISGFCAGNATGLQWIHVTKGSNAAHWFLFCEHIIIEQTVEFSATWDQWLSCNVTVMALLDILYLQAQVNLLY